MAPPKSSIVSGLKATIRTTSKAQSDTGGGSGEVSAELLKYLEREGKFHAAVAHKWLGMDAGETAKSGKGGEAVGFLQWAQQELEDLHTGRLTKGLGIGRDGDQDIKHRVEKELESLRIFLAHYRKMNDSLTFDPVPKQSELQALIPEGRTAISAKPFALAEPAFGPGSKNYQTRTRSPGKMGDNTLGIETLMLAGDDSDDSDTEQASAPTRTYVGAGSYF